MSFELFIPNSSRGDSIKAGTVSINAAGTLAITASDLHRIGVLDAATLLCDVTGRRFAIRKPRNGEPTVKVRLNKTKTTGNIGIKGLLAQMKVDPAKSRGRYDLVSKDDMAFVQLPLK